jgi:hypothetical protein
MGLNQLARVDLNREQDENYTVYVEFNQPV